MAMGFRESFDFPGGGFIVGEGIGCVYRCFGPFFLLVIL
jgi:hypothetical protein